MEIPILIRGDLDAKLGHWFLYLTSMALATGHKNRYLTIQLQHNYIFKKINNIFVYLVMFKHQTWTGHSNETSHPCYTDPTPPLTPRATLCLEESQNYLRTTEAGTCSTELSKHLENKKYNYHIITKMCLCSVRHYDRHLQNFVEIRYQIFKMWRSWNVVFLWRLLSETGSWLLTALGIINQLGHIRTRPNNISSYPSADPRKHPSTQIRHQTQAAGLMAKLLFISGGFLSPHLHMVPPLIKVRV